MQKQNVFAVTGRQQTDGIPAGPVLTMVVCALNEAKVRKLVATSMPSFWVTTVTSLAVLEDRARKIRDALGNKVPEWQVLVDPELLAPAPPAGPAVMGAAAMAAG